MQNIPKEPMSYKHYKQEHELVTKLRIIRRVLADDWTQRTTAESFSCHRNTVSNLISVFFRVIPGDDQQRLLTESLSEEQITDLLSPLRDQSTRPHSHPRTATHEQANRVAAIFNDLKVKTGSKRLQTILRRKYHDSTDPINASLASMGITKLRTIYRTHELKREHARATSGSYRPLYDYASLSCFEYMHFDTKHILDKKALPPKVYDYFSTHPREIPRYEWNLIDAKSRCRFTAYSYEINAAFGFHFLSFVVGCIRTATNNWEIPIRIGQDNGVEFCSGSPRKAEDWNRMLTPLNASIYPYNPYWDIRKNLIERSHRTDDEELFIPRGEFIHTEEEFMNEVRSYGTYWNTQRSHSGIGMGGRTPMEVIRQSGLMGGMRLQSVPVLILDHHINTLQECITPLLFAHDIRETEKKKQQKHLDMKELYDLKSKYFFTDSAQKVLTYYLFSRFLFSECFVCGGGGRR